MKFNNNLEQRFINCLKYLKLNNPDIPPFEKIGISKSQLNIIEWIFHNPGCSLNDISRGLKLTSPTVSVSIRNIETKNLIIRKNNKLDKRSIIFFLTKKGINLIKKVELYRKQITNSLLNNLTENEKELFISLFEKSLKIKN